MTKFKNTSAKQLALFSKAIILACEKSSTVTQPFLPLFLKSSSHLSDGKEIDYDSKSFEDKIRLKQLDWHINETASLMIAIKLLKTEDKYLNHDSRPLIEVSYLRVTAFGKKFATSPLLIQMSILFTAASALRIKETVIKYKWIASVISASIAAYGFIKADKFSTIWAAAVVVGGVVAAFISAWVRSLFESSSNP